MRIPQLILVFCIGNKLCSCGYSYLISGRKLLGQYVPYNLTIPPFADGIHSSLENQLVPLWLCYW